MAKKEIHPKSSLVLFEDTSNMDYKFLIESTAVSNQTVKVVVNGVEIEVMRIGVRITSKTHPFFTGKFNEHTDSDNKIKTYTDKFGMFTE